MYTNVVLKINIFIKTGKYFFLSCSIRKKQPEDASSLGKTKTLCEFSQDNFCIKSILKNKNLVL